MKLTIYFHLLIKPKLFYWLNLIKNINTYAGSAKPLVYTIIFLTSVLAKMYYMLAIRSFL
jgi:hypothetical protein